MISAIPINLDIHSFTAPRSELDTSDKHGHLSRVVIVHQIKAQLLERYATIYCVFEQIAPIYWEQFRIDIIVSGGD